jgi:hypothetical protein
MELKNIERAIDGTVGQQAFAASRGGCFRSCMFLPNGHSKGLWNPRCLVTVGSFRNQFAVCDGIAHLLAAAFPDANKNVSQLVG